MPKRTDIKKILIIGAGPIVIGQACEFDYSGSQACKALKEEGYEVILINSNPATIMTDPELADRTYIEPITPSVVEMIIEAERPDALLPTIGGQTALNTAIAVYENGVLEKYGVEMIGANYEAIQKAESRELFNKAMTKIGLDMAKNVRVKTYQAAKEAIKDIGYPVIIRPSFTLGGTGGSIAYNEEEFDFLMNKALSDSPIHEVIMDESLLGWKEYELEVMRDKNDNVVIICSIENFDPMGVHTGDSITVAPAQTLTDYEYQMMRDASIRVIREIGVDTGGSNIQFAIHPQTGRMIVIEMNPRVSRSSALASKATGFPIAKIAAKLAIGYTLDEIPNDITKETPASFEPTIDYCVVKIPRWTFEKFAQAKDELGIQMKSVGETMAIGRTFKEAFQKGIRGLEISRFGFENEIYRKKKPDNASPDFDNEKNLIIEKIRNPNSKRIFYLKDAFDIGMSIDEIYAHSAIDPWFLYNLKEINDLEKELIAPLDKIPYELMLKAKEFGFSDVQIARLTGTDEMTVRQKRKEMGIVPVYKLVDTCAAEFEAKTPYFYSTYDRETEIFQSDKKKVMIIGGGPNRIGQGIEFDYMCCHAAYVLKEYGFETIMVNSNPETVSTDYDTSDKLYFEPLTFEDVVNIYEYEKPIGAIVQLGGQTPLNLSKRLLEANVNILGTSSDTIDRAEDRDRFKDLIEKLQFLQPANETAYSVNEAIEIADNIGYPVVVRPSYVLGGRAMEIVYSQERLKKYMTEAIEASPEKPILIDKFLEDAIEVDVDSVCDGEEAVICGFMEHIEQAGIHSGDSACVIPAYSLNPAIIKRIEELTIKTALELGVVGLMNIQFAVKNDDVYFLEVNPRGSRTIPFVSKATGIPWAKVASLIMVGYQLKQFNLERKPTGMTCVKEVVLPFNKFPGVDTRLGPEMRSTGEVMGICNSFGVAYFKSQMAANSSLPLSGRVFVSFSDKTKPKLMDAVRRMRDMGYQIVATRGTRNYLLEHGIDSEFIHKAHDGSPDILDLIQEGKIDLIFNTPAGAESRTDEIAMHKKTIQFKVPYLSTVPGIRASVNGLEQAKRQNLTVHALQDILGYTCNTMPKLLK